MFWPKGARIAVATSLMFEAGSQDLQKALGPIPVPQEGKLPDLATNSWFDYAANEGIPRALALFDRHGVVATSFMTGMSVERYPDVAREIVAHGHEAAAHGFRWSPSYQLSRSDEKDFIADGSASVERVTGYRPVGWNAHSMRNSANTLEILRELEFTYFIDDLSRDEPFIISLGRDEIAAVPYTAHLNDLHNLLHRYDLAQFEFLMKEEFDQLYEEAASRRRMMVVSLHDRVGTRPASIRMFDRVFEHIRKRDDVWFARKDQIASWALANREHTPVVKREPSPISGLPRPEQEGKDMKSNRTVVVTGAAGGMGTLVVQRFLANGDTVIATDTKEEPLAKLKGAYGPDAKLHTQAADVTSEQDCQAVAALAKQVSGSVDVLVNVAGFFPTQSFEETTAADFRRVVDINLTGVFLMIKAVHPLMKGRGWGRIVSIGSASTFEGVPTQIHYVAAKAGLFGMSRSIARDFGKDGITVNVVTPGLTLTPIVKKNMPAEMIEEQIKLRCIPREEQAEDLIGTIFFLASPDADFISGQTVNVDGGKHML